MPDLHLELQNGAAGDMLLAALIDCGADYDHIVSTLRKLDLYDWDIRLDKVIRSGISAQNITITDNTIPTAKHEHLHSDQEEETKHQHTHRHLSGDNHHTHHHQQQQQQHHHHHHHHHAGRHLDDLLKVLDNPALSDNVKEKAAAVFNLIAEAEGAIHNKSKNSIHFHEISGIDTLIDVIGTALAIENLGVTRITATPVASGSGTVSCAHGIMPVPAPATLKIACEKQIPIYAGSIKSELLTPTGAALLGIYIDEFCELPGGRIICTGYGAGDKDFSDTANVVRAVLYTAETAEKIADSIIEITFTVDDATGEEVGDLQEMLYNAGALESYCIPTVMKKNRPGFEIKTLLRPEDREKITAVIFDSGMTIGMRISKVNREILDRKITEVTIADVIIPVKISYYQNKAVTVKAEADIVSDTARRLHRGFREIKQEAENLAKKQL